MSATGTLSSDLSLGERHDFALAANELHDALDERTSLGMSSSTTRTRLGLRR